MAPQKKKYLSPLKELAQLKARIKLVRKNLAAEPAELRNPPRQPLWKLIEAYLQESGQGEAVAFETILQAMIDAGHELGRYPRRSVKQCIVSPYLRSVFQVSIENDVEVVKLRAGNIQYISPTHRLPQQAKASSRPA